MKEIRNIANNRYEETSIALPKLHEDVSSQVEQIQAQKKNGILKPYQNLKNINRY